MLEELQQQEEEKLILQETKLRELRNQLLTMEIQFTPALGSWPQQALSPLVDRIAPREGTETKEIRNRQKLGRAQGDAAVSFLAPQLTRRFAVSLEETTEREGQERADEEEEEAWEKERAIVDIPAGLLFGGEVSELPSLMLLQK